MTLWQGFLAALRRAVPRATAPKPAPAPARPRVITTKRAVGATSAAVMAGAVALIQPWEGLYTKPYFDIVGVKTVCYGATAAEGIDLNRSYTPQECRDLLKASLVKYDNGLKACLNRDIPDSMHVAFISATYNIGVKGFCGSSMARLVNAGDLRGACDALLLWNKASGRVVKGLDNRRQDERRVCLKDIT